MSELKRAWSFDQALFDFRNILRQGIADVAEGIANTWTQQAYNTDHNKRHKSDNDRILDQALTSFL
jgi:hypothetical protein